MKGLAMVNSNGTQVLVSRIDPLLEKPFQGSVITHTPTQIKVSFPELFDLDGSEWRYALRPFSYK
jgi:hypothetical protein